MPAAADQACDSNRAVRRLLCHLDMQWRGDSLSETRARAAFVIGELGSCPDRPCLAPPGQSSVACVASGPPGEEVPPGTVSNRAWEVRFAAARRVREVGVRWPCRHQQRQARIQPLDVAPPYSDRSARLPPGTTTTGTPIRPPTAAGYWCTARGHRRTTGKQRLLPPVGKCFVGIANSARRLQVLVAIRRLRQVVSAVSALPRN
jgi:hypothetical protein